jgi:Raf kinase inhibitor-like YbhB/YbcL family protein
MIKHFFPFAVALMLSGPAVAFEVTSPDMTDGKTLGKGQIAKNEHCSGGDVSPGLAWKDPPAGTKSFVVTMYDPDAPTGSGWWHWTVYNIPASATGLPTGAGSGGKGLPAGAVQGRTDAGTAGFGGACPPPGLMHHYIVTVTALKTEKLDLPKDASAAMLGFMTGMNSLGKATITATYGH